MTDRESKNLDLFCPRCNMQVEANVLASARGEVTEEIASLVEPDDLEFMHIRYHMALCRRCSGPFLVEMAVRSDAGDFMELASERVLFPAERSLSNATLPDLISKSYREAARAFAAGLYDACAIMCRKCLEALCAEKGIRGKDLASRLSSLQSAGTIDERLFRWADQLRLVGNDAAHDLSSITDANDARDTLEFVEAILTYVYVLGTRFEEFVQRRKAKRTT